MLHTQNVDVFHVSWFWSLYIHHQLIGKGYRHYIYQWEWSPVKGIIFVSWSLDCKVLELKKQIVIYIVLMSASLICPFLQVGILHHGRHLLLKILVVSFLVWQEIAACNIISRVVIISLFCIFCFCFAEAILDLRYTFFGQFFEFILTS